MGYTPFSSVENHEMLDNGVIIPENIFWEKRKINITTTAQTLVFNLSKDAAWIMLRFMTLYIVSGTANNRARLSVRVGDTDYVVKAQADLDLYGSLHDGDVMYVPPGSAVVVDVYNAGGTALAELSYAGVNYYK